jgi:hypothetical protein
MGLSMGANLDLLRSTYERSSEDNSRNLLAALAPDAARRGLKEFESMDYVHNLTG